MQLEMLRACLDSLTLQVHIICIFSFFIVSVSVSISFERLYFHFYITFVLKITIVYVSVNVGSIIFISVTEISLAGSWPTCRLPVWLRLMCIYIMYYAASSAHVVITHTLVARPLCYSVKSHPATALIIFTCKYGFVDKIFSFWCSCS